jgi:hypothetical protein
MKDRVDLYVNTFFLTRDVRRLIVAEGLNYTTWACE